MSGCPLPDSSCSRQRKEPIGKCEHFLISALLSDRDADLVELLRRGRGGGFCGQDEPWTAYCLVTRRISAVADYAGELAAP